MGEGRNELGSKQRVGPELALPCCFSDAVLRRGERDDREQAWMASPCSGAAGRMGMKYV